MVEIKEQLTQLIRAHALGGLRNQHQSPKPNELRASEILEAIETYDTELERVIEEIKQELLEDLL